MNLNFRAKNAWFSLQIRYHIPLQSLSREKECLDGKPAQKKMQKFTFFATFNFTTKISAKKFWSYACT